MASATYSITVSNSTGPAPSFSLSLTVRIAPPSGLSYPSPAIALVGVAYTLSPAVTGTVTSYTASPNLPAPLSLNPTTGVISGMPPPYLIGTTTYVITASNSAGAAAPFTLSLTINPAIALSAVASSPSGAQPNYYWRTTDGQITNGAALVTTQPTLVSQPVAGSFATWMLPQGPGLHFAYLLVSDGTGNCSESRLAVSSDSIEVFLPSPPTGQWPNTDYSIWTQNGGSFPCTQLTEPFFAGKPNSSTSGSQTPVFNCPGNSQQGPPFSSQASMICSMSGTYNGQTIGTTQPVFPAHLNTVTVIPDSSGLTPGKVNEIRETSDGIAPSNVFLNAASQINTPADACSYYNAIGAFGYYNPSGVLVGAKVNCNDSNGNPTGNPTVVSGVLPTFADWQARNQLTGVGITGVQLATPAAPAYFVNVEDLGLTREHHSITYLDTANNNANSLAAYVCNYPGPSDSSGTSVPPGVQMTVNPTLPGTNPPFGTNPTPGNTGYLQTSVDNAVTNAQAHSNLIGCVAMDYVNNIDGNQYTRFYIFGPSGGLLPSVNLDGRGEKYVPGVCTACHGGNGYPTSSGSGNLSAYFLPYDVFNLAFSDQSPLDASSQSAQLFSLNYNVSFPYKLASTNGNPISYGTANLIANWYSMGTSPNWNFSYVPTTWNTQQTFYSDVVARSCRTCHTALPNDWDSSTPQNFASSASNVVCSQYQMPNSVSTFNRFWDSHLFNINSTDPLESLGPDEVAAFLVLSGVPSCGPPPIPQD